MSAPYLKRVELIADDSRRHLRRLVVAVDSRIRSGTLRVAVRPIAQGAG